MSDKLDKQFTVDQIASRVNSLYEYLSERSLKIKTSDLNVDSIQELYQQFDDIFEKLGKLKTLSKVSVVKPLEEARNKIVVEAVQTGKYSSENLMKLSKLEFGYRKKAESKNEAVVEDPFITNDSQESPFGNDNNFQL